MALLTQARTGVTLFGRCGRIALACLPMLLCLAPGRALPATLEYQVKASYLYNFMRFVTWPDDVLAKTDKFNLCVVGVRRFGDALDELAGERIEGREILVRPLEQADQGRTAQCHLLFLAAGAGTGGVSSEHGVLTIGETPGFLERGGMINLVEVGGRVRFEINQPATQRAGLTVSSRLLDLAVRRL